jgi:prolyl 4-hydroxylase
LSAIARAQAFDADGRHDEAVNELANAAQRGDAEAMTQLAKRLIVGDRAPRLRRHGVGLLADAVKLGSAEAADRLAVIHASGVVAPPDWPAALKLLALAAERGWVPARSQLEVLASMPRDGLLVPPPSAVVHEDPHIRHFPGFVSERVCDWLIERARGRLERARVYDAHRKADVVDDSRTNSFAVFNAMEADLVHLMVQTRMTAGCGQPVKHMEASTVLHYAVGETIGYHYDFVDPALPGFAEEVRARGHRVATFLVYLNDGYEGGETIFPRIGVRHAGRRGDGVLFVNTLTDGQADVRTQHSGEPPTRGEKRVFSQFVRHRPENVAD